MILNGASFTVNPWSHSFLSLAVNSTAFGIGVGAISVAIQTKARMITGGKSIATLMSYLWLISSFGRLISGSVTGRFDFEKRRDFRMAGATSGII